MNEQIILLNPYCYIMNVRVVKLHVAFLLDIDACNDMRCLCLIFTVFVSLSNSLLILLLIQLILGRQL